MQYLLRCISPKLATHRPFAALHQSFRTQGVSGRRADMMARTVRDPFSPSLACAGCGAALARVVLLSANHLAVNLKAEFEICHLHEKLRHLINWQWVRLAKSSGIQLEIMEDLARAKDDAAPGLITKFWAPLPPWKACCTKNALTLIWRATCLANSGYKRSHRPSPPDRSPDWAWSDGWSLTRR